jgi:hypothetical protein
VQLHVDPDVTQVHIVVPLQEQLPAGVEQLRDVDIVSVREE